MAKVTGPLLSIGAIGSIGKTVVFASWRGVKYARQHVIPANPQTTAQQLTRTTFSTLASLWKLGPALLIAPFVSFAQGKPKTGANAFIGENLRVVLGESDMQNFIGSPGSKGGLSIEAAAASTGSGSGEVDVTFTVATPPAGWTLESVVACAFPDQDPAVGFGGPIVADENDTTKDVVTLTGLGAGVACVTSGWAKWTKPNGDTAYSVAIADTATSGA